jgi:hypothetical protein
MSTLQVRTCQKEQKARLRRDRLHGYDIATLIEF